jgi:AraC-like DNA-binding protein
MTDRNFVEELSGIGDPHPIKRRFFEKMGPACRMDVLFQCIPGISFFAKDLDLKFTIATSFLVERLGFQHESELLGKTDFEVFPLRLAENYAKDDQKVIETCKPMRNIVELFPSRDGLPEWYLTQKFPVLDTSGAIMGVMGITQSYEHYKKVSPPYLTLSKAVSYIQENYSKDISIDELASLVHLSRRQFERRFKSLFHTTPIQYLIRTRIYHACDLLAESDLPLSHIALNVGFYDHSAFTNQFKKSMRLTPSEYRKKYRQ